MKIKLLEDEKVEEERVIETVDVINDNNTSTSYLKLEKILLEKGVSVYDISLSTGLPINRVLEIVQKGKGYIPDINKVMGCLEVSIEECIDKEKIMEIKNSERQFVDFKEVFQKKSIIDLIEPEDITLVKSFHEQSEIRYAIKTYPLSVKDKSVSSFISTKGVKEKDAARKEYEKLLNSKFHSLKDTFPKPDQVSIEEIEYNTLELLLEYYNVRFDAFDSSILYHIGSVSSLNQISNYNDKYLKKVHGICAKPQNHIIRSSIYSQSDLDNGKIEEHMELMSMYDISFKGKNIIEFLVPHSFDETKYYIETNAIYNEIYRLSFNIKKKRI